MIENQLQSGLGHLLLTPNRSLSWQGNKLLLVSVGLILIATTAGFATMGAWMIAPFAGLELLALFLGLYITALRQHDREVLTFTPSEVCLQRGRLHPHQEFRFPREWARFIVRTSPYRAHPRRLLLRCHGREVEVARYLSEDDREALIAELRTVVQSHQLETECGKRANGSG